jgi:4-hydroxy-tetrahydrodipicolinate reductase
MRAALIGYGKMGKAVEKVLLAQGHSVGLTVNRAGRDQLTEEALRGCDVAIEFTGPDSAAENIRLCLQAGLPVVSGSTGWLGELPSIRALCESAGGSFIHASNFSIGVNLFFELNRLLAGMMADHAGYDPVIREIHHTGKKDAPSGTALTLADTLLHTLKRKKTWTGRPPQQGEELYIESIREDPAPGTHTVNYHSYIDDITITHTAHNREGFATGAVLAAAYLQGRKGIYTMQDVLGLPPLKAGNC